MGKRAVQSRVGRRGRRASQPARSEPSGDNGSLAEVYLEMLAETQPPGLEQSTETRSTKRRRVGERTTASYDPAPMAPPKSAGASEEIVDEKATQTVYDIDASDESEVDDWEDVELPVPESTSQVSTSRQGDVELQITLKPETKGKQRVSTRRKAVSGAEKRWRLDIHKAHLLCLLGHVQLRNSWCNDDEAQRTLRRVLSKHIVQLLNPRAEMSQFTRSTTFADGLNQASEAFRRRFKIIAPGMKRPFWLENINAGHDSIVIPENVEILLSREDFRRQAKCLEGSRDLGAQLFCTMLRAVDVDARLVCSLQPLPFGGVAKGDLPTKPVRDYITLPDDNPSEGSSMSAPGTPKSDTPAQRLRRLGQPQFAPSPPQTSRPKSSSAIYSPVAESAYPIFWVEAFNEAMQKWIAVEPIVTNTIGKFSRFEPPASDKYNNMSYVVAWEEDGSARDVTRRYTKAFNSKTRKNRVEYTKHGEEWWEATLQFFEKPFLDDRDQVEIGDLTAKTAAEGMPKNIQDFKNHPIYALERHLRRNEVIHPKREIGKVGLSKISANSRSQPLESVYRRSDVHLVKSADGWYRQGRCIKPGEQPLKRVRVSKRKMANETNYDDDDLDEEGLQETAMYAFSQTDLYKPPALTDDRVPKNVYGNIDIYVSSMVPEGGFHLKDGDAARAAKILGIDYADAVTRFKFKGRHGTAVTEGIVASVAYREALIAVVNGLHDERLQAEQDRKTMAALQMWRQLLLKLRIAERVQGYAAEGEENSESDVTKPTDSNPEESGGGFLPDDSNSADVSYGDMRSLNSLEHQSTYDSHEGGSSGGFSGGGFVPESNHSARPTAHAPVAIHSHNAASSSAPPPRYRLVVIPQEGPSNEVSQTVTTSAQIPSAAPLQVQAPQLLNELPCRPSSSMNDSQLNSIWERSRINRSLSVEEISGLPDLIHNDSDSEIDDQHSMISHDPEDDDAEPEWLLSD